MGRILFRVGLVIGSLALLGGVAWAAWAQGETRGYTNGYEAGKRDERAAARLSDKDVFGLVRTYLGSHRYGWSACDEQKSSMEYRSGLWVVRCERDKAVPLTLTVVDSSGVVHGPAAGSTYAPGVPQPPRPPQPSQPSRFAPFATPQTFARPTPTPGRAFAPP